MSWGLRVCSTSSVDWWSYDDDEHFADSKTLSHGKRTGLLNILSSQSEHMGWSVRVLWYAGIMSPVIVRDNIWASVLRRYRAGC